MPSFLFSDKISSCMKIKALLFDFDGLILDTETPEFRVWQAIYREHGHELDAESWGRIVGGGGDMSLFDAAKHLAELAGDGVSADATCVESCPG